MFSGGRKPKRLFIQPFYFKVIETEPPRSEGLKDQTNLVNRKDGARTRSLDSRPSYYPSIHNTHIQSIPDQ